MGCHVGAGSIGILTIFPPTPILHISLFMIRLIRKQPLLSTEDKNDVLRRFLSIAARSRNFEIARNVFVSPVAFPRLRRGTVVKTIAAAIGDATATKFPGGHGDAGNIEAESHER